MDFFDKLVGGDKKKKKDDKKPPMKNPFANVGKAFQGNKTFEGTGKSLGGSKPGKLIHMELAEPGPLGVKIEKRPNSAGTAIVAMVVPGSQAERAGLQRGDIICFAGTNGDEEIMYDMFVELAASSQRPLHFDIRRIETKSTSTTGTDASAEAFARKQAVIAAAEAREKAAKRWDKPIPKRAAAKKDEAVVDLNADIPDVPQSEEARRAIEAAKRGESHLAAQLGYNPYESNKTTAGQARNATVATKHGAVNAGVDVSAMPGAVPPPRDATNSVNDSGPAVNAAFQHAFEECVTSNEHAVVVTSFSILRKLITNATTKGQVGGEENAKFRKVRLSNAKIRESISDVVGALDIMMACGFLLVEEDDESYLAYPPGEKGPVWLSRALRQMQEYEQSS
ncbi:PUB domain [Fragilaria crotonensis]|nr:PUB domain [Fragilaria crotonensis]